MKISLQWLNDYLQTPVAVDAVGPLLTAQGFPVEETVQHESGPASGDTMFDVEVTSNRGDCLSHIGVAREVAAGTNGALKLPEIAGDEQGDAASEATSVTLEASDACPLYTARVIKGVNVGPSPSWLVAKLEAVGLRSVNNVVDVTNFVLLEMGQPLHAFDLGKLSGRRVVVRSAKAGEAFTAIDGTKHKLTDGMLVIADADRPQAVAGVMGGLDSEVGDDTTDILLESAIFEPLQVRTTSRALKLSSDSSFRFERGVDPLGVDRASRRAAQLIVELAGGQLLQGVVRVGQDDPPVGEVAMRIARCNALLGLDLSGQAQAAYLNSIGLNARVDADRVVATVPSFRLDLLREVDLIEEVARLHGMDAIPTKQKIELTARPPQDSVLARQRIAEVMVAHGYHETVTFSFIRPNLSEPFLPEGAEALMLAGDHKKDEPMLRASVLPSLLQCRKLNQDAGNRGVKLFESASTWAVINGKAVETRRLAMLRDAEDADAAVRELRGTIDELIETLGGAAALETFSVEPFESDHLYAAAGRLMLSGEAIGVLGVVSPSLRDRFAVQTPQASAELDVDAVAAMFPATPSVSALPRFPGIERDLSIIINESVQWQEIVAAVSAAKPELMESLSFVGVYRGKPIAKGQKSVSLRMQFRDPSSTLRHDQVDPQVAAVLESLKAKLNAELRS